LEDQVCGGFLQSIVRHTFHVSEKIDFHIVAVDGRFHPGTLGGMVVSAREQDLTIDQLREFSRCVYLPEIVQVFGRVGAIVGEFIRLLEIALSPDIERLPTDDECSVRERQCGRDAMDDVSGKRFAAQR
jgi:hypothetical protein